MMMMVMINKMKQYNYNLHEYIMGNEIHDILVTTLLADDNNHPMVSHVLWMMVSMIVIVVISLLFSGKDGGERTRRSQLVEDPIG